MKKDIELDKFQKEAIELIEKGYSVIAVSYTHLTLPTKA